MATVALIHGAMQNASCWERVRGLLSEHGHETIGVELPADRPDLDATALARIAAEQFTGDDCVVAAHGFAGILLPRIAQIRPVAALVYVAAVVPETGKSLLDQGLAGDWLTHAPANWREAADEVLFHDLLQTDLPWARTTLRPMQLDAALREPLREGTNARQIRAVPSMDRVLKQHVEDRDMRMRTGHCPHITSPREAASPIFFGTRVPGAGGG